MLLWCRCLSAPRWPSRASGSIPHLHLPSRTHGEHQRRQRHHGELWPRPSGPGIIERAGPGGLRPEAAPLLRRGAETSAHDQEGSQDAGSQWTEGTTSDTAPHTGASPNPPPHFILKSTHLTRMSGELSAVQHITSASVQKLFSSFVCLQWFNLLFFFA